MNQMAVVLCVQKIWNERFISNEHRDDDSGDCDQERNATHRNDVVGEELTANARRIRVDIVRCRLRHR